MRRAFSGVLAGTSGSSAGWGRGPKRRPERARSAPHRSEDPLEGQSGRHDGPQAIVVQRHEDVRCDTTVLAESNAKSDRCIDDVVALDLEEEGQIDVRLRSQLVTTEEGDPGGERLD